MEHLKEIINDFIFDVIGLIIPAIVMTMMFVLISYKVGLNNDYIWKCDLEWYHIALLLILMYVLGHIIKVMSTLLYTSLSLISEVVCLIVKRICNLISSLKSRGQDESHKILRKKSSLINKNTDTEIITRLKCFINLITSFMFRFKPKEYSTEFEKVYKTSFEKIVINESENSKSYKNRWYEYYCNVLKINKNYNIKNLADKFLAKYNMYRSMALVSIVNFVYYMLVIDVKNIYFCIFLFISFITFNNKYLKYYELTGNEIVMSADYYVRHILNKEVKNDK